MNALHRRKPILQVLPESIGNAKLGTGDLDLLLRKLGPGRSASCSASFMGSSVWHSAVAPPSSTPNRTGKGLCNPPNKCVAPVGFPYLRRKRPVATPKRHSLSRHNPFHLRLYPALSFFSLLPALAKKSRPKRGRGTGKSDQLRGVYRPPKKKELTHFAFVDVQAPRIQMENTGGPCPKRRFLPRQGG